MVSTIPLYMMHLTQLLNATIKQIEKLCHNFLWGRNCGEQKLSFVKWSTICQPKSSNGFGLRNSKDSNVAFLMKLCLQIIADPKDLEANIRGRCVIFLSG